MTIFKSEEKFTRQLIKKTSPMLINDNSMFRYFIFPRKDLIRNFPFQGGVM